MRVSTAWPSPLLVDDDGHPHRPARQAGLDQHLALDELEVLAIAGGVLGEVPAIRHAPMIEVRDGAQRLVHLAVHADDGVPNRRGKGDRRRLTGIHRTFRRVAQAEVRPGGDWLGFSPGDDHAGNRRKCRESLGCRGRRGGKDGGERETETEDAASSPDETGQSLLTHRNRDLHDHCPSR